MKEIKYAIKRFGSSVLEVSTTANDFPFIRLHFKCDPIEFKINKLVRFKFVRIFQFFSFTDSLPLGKVNQNPTSDSK